METVAALAGMKISVASLQLSAEMGKCRPHGSEILFVNVSMRDFPRFEQRHVWGCPGQPWSEQQGMGTNPSVPSWRRDGGEHVDSHTVRGSKPARQELA